MGNRFAVVFFVKVIVNLAQSVCGDRSVGLGQLVSLEFEFGKHGLSEQRGAEHIEVVAEQIFFHFHVFGFGNEVLKHQNFVHGAGDFGNENDVVAL